MHRGSDPNHMDANIERSTLGGRPRAPPSKSYTHRAVLAAGYGSEATVHGPLISADTQATRRAVEAYGGETDLSEDHSTLTVEGFDGLPEVPADVIDCANSGTTMRLTTATAALADGGRRDRLCQQRDDDASHDRDCGTRRRDDRPHRR